MAKDPSIQEIKSQVNLLLLAKHLGVIRKGNNFICPFHKDKDPSMGIKDEKYKCFACGANGDCYTLVMHMMQVSFKGALLYLKSYIKDYQPGLSESRIDHTVIDVSDEDRAIVLTDLISKTELKNQDASMDIARNWLESRGIHKSSYENSRIGWVSNYIKLKKYLRSRYSDDRLKAVGIMNKSGNLKIFKHRLLIPYIKDDKVVGLQARHIGEEDGYDGPKEIMLSRITQAFGGEMVKRHPEKTIYITEGMIDSLTLRSLGILAVGIPGVNTFQLDWFKESKAKRIVLALDNDKPGIEARDKIAKILSKSFDVYFMDLPEGVKDVNEYSQMFKDLEKKELANNFKKMVREYK